MKVTLALIKNKFLDWFKFYLSNLTSVVKINDSISDIKFTTNGVSTSRYYIRA